MEVRDIFKLRKEGRTEEAYQAIIPMYKNHHGHFTTMAMFWVGNDMLQLRLAEKKHDEAVRIFRSLCRVYPGLDDKDGRGQSVMLHNALKIADIDDHFSMTDFIIDWDISRLGTADWTGGTYNGHPVPSVAQRIIGRIYREVELNQTLEMANLVVPILQVALQHSQYNLTYQRFLALLYKIEGQRDKAVELYNQMLKKHKLSYLYSEMAELVEDAQQKIALYCQAIITQREEKFRVKNRIHLAELLFVTNDKPRAAYEIQKSIADRQQEGFHLSNPQVRLARELKDVLPVSEQDENEFYRQESRQLQYFLG